MFTRIVTIAFWLSLGLNFLSVHFPYQAGVIGVTALIIGIIAIIGPGTPGTRPVWF